MQTITDKQWKEIDQARDILKSYGFYVDNLWHIDDVIKNWDCGEETAQIVLENAMENESTYEQIWCSIDNAAFFYNLNPIK
jgi:hypothetical protein